MPLDESVHHRRDRAEVFGTVAADYDRYRPGYPAELIDELLRPGPRTVLDIGCGTGKAARLIAARGPAVVGVEIDPQMAEVARGHGLTVEVDRFEDWDDRGRTFDLVISAQAWHWVDPSLAAPKVARLLTAAGRAAFFWNFDEFDGPLQAALDAVYARLAPELADQPRLGRGRDERPYLAQLQGTGAFASLEVRSYPWVRTLPVAEWVGQIGTHSDHLLLGEQRLTAVQEGVRAALLEFGPTVSSRGGTYTIFASA